MIEEIPDPSEVLQQARQLTREGKYAEALEKHLCYHENALEHGRGQAGVRLSFALGDWFELGEKYPPARQAMIDIRDEKTARIRSSQGDSSLFHDVSALNRRLMENHKTVDLFKFLHECQPDLAQSSIVHAEESLVAAGEYQLCSHYVPTPLNNLKLWQEILTLDSKLNSRRSQTLLETNKNYTPEMHARYLATGTRLFTESVVRLIKILVGSDRKPEAEAVHAQAISMLDDPEFHTPINQALNPEQ